MLLLKQLTYWNSVFDIFILHTKLYEDVCPPYTYFSVNMLKCITINIVIFFCVTNDPISSSSKWEHIHGGDGAQVSSCSQMGIFQLWQYSVSLSHTFYSCCRCLAQEHLISSNWRMGESYSFTFHSQMFLARIDYSASSSVQHCWHATMYVHTQTNWHSWASGGSSLLLYMLNWDIWSTAY